MTRILITGGTGSFGGAFVARLLDIPDVDRIIVYSRDEQKQHELARRFPDPRLACFLGDIRDRDRLTMACRGVDAVIHAAALKIVPAGEFDPSEFIKTNVLGTDNVVHAALAAGVERCILLSTDKAVAPINLYGATKLAAEKLFIAANSYATAGKPRFSVVRYGNVAGSRGSVIPAWHRIIARWALATNKGDPGTEWSTLPLTDERMTRFWITLPDAVQFVLQALEVMEGGEVFIPRMPSFRLTDLAMAMGRPYSVVGLRPGEKLHEDLITPHEAPQALIDPSAIVICPPGSRPDKPPPDGWHLTSATNPEFLTVTALQERLAHV